MRHARSTNSRLRWRDPLVICVTHCRTGTNTTHIYIPHQHRQLWPGPHSVQLLMCPLFGLPPPLLHVQALDDLQRHASCGF